jgi:hypothetical protein
MEAVHPLFTFTNNGWKLNYLIVSTYPGWVLNHLNKKTDEDGSISPSSSSRSRGKRKADGTSPETQSGPSPRKKAKHGRKKDAKDEAEEDIALDKDFASWDNLDEIGFAHEGQSISEIEALYPSRASTSTTTCATTPPPTLRQAVSTASRVPTTMAATNGATEPTMDSARATTPPPTSSQAISSLSTSSEVGSVVPKETNADPL